MEECHKTKTTKEIIDSLMEIVKSDTDPNYNKIDWAFTVSPAEAMCRIVTAAVRLERLEYRNKILTEKSKAESAGEDDQDDAIDNLKTMLLCERRIRDLTDKVTYQNGQISVYKSLFASFFDSDSPQADI